MISRRDALVLGSGLAGVVLATRTVLAQSRYPERPIRLVIPFVPGGVTDVVGRHWANAMKALLGSVVIENQGGAGGTIGAAAVARAAADGYTILLGSAPSLVVNPIAGPTRYDPVSDFAPISILGVVPVAFLANPALPARNLAELVAYAKANPGKLSYGTPGAGTMGHLGGELLKSLAGTSDVVHVPYKGAGPALSDVIGGQIPLALLSVNGQMLELHQSGKVRIISVAAATRLVSAPDIPTVVEQGFPGLVTHNFYGLFAPAATPLAIIEQMSHATRTAMADDKFREQLVAAGFEPYRDASSEAARRFLADEIARWRPVITAAGLKLGMRRSGSDRA
jgi:tripartite-type tricarboxylate transporter receptor subunit TctC